MAVRFLHTADLQLGMRRHFLDEDAQPRFVQARIDAIRSMARVARERECEFAVACGDVFESNQVDARTVARALEAFGEFPCPVFLLPGNHDPLQAASVYLSSEFQRRKPEHVSVLDSFDPVEVRPGVEIVGAPWTSKRPLEDLVDKALRDLPPARGAFRVCVAHGIVDSLSPDRDDPARIRLAAVERAIAEERIHYLALGDRHSFTEVAPRVYYPGAPEPTAFDETDPGRVLVVTLDEGACGVETPVLGRWKFHLLEADLRSREEVEAFGERLGSLEDKEHAVLKLALQGTLSLAAKARLDEILEQAREVFASLYRSERRSDLAVLPDDADLTRLGLTGFARKTLDALAERAENEEAASDALALLYRLAGGGSA